MARPRKQTYTLSMYLNKIKEGDICNDADVQRKFVWSKDQINELMATVLTDDYIPSLILGEEENSQLHIADGGCRSAALMVFRYGNYKITSSIENSVIPYKKKVKDENGNITWEDAEFDIKNKTFNQLPEELKKRFDEYQIETVIHENCDRYAISKYIKRYNNSSSMNVSQKAFTYIYNYAEKIRNILDKRFFIEHSCFTEKEKTNGVIERVIIESLMCMFHLDDWKKQTKHMAAFLNENSSMYEFNKLEKNIERLEKIIDEDTKVFFNSKDAFIWLSVFNKFTEYNLNDTVFASFLKVFNEELQEKEVEGETYIQLNTYKGTKDKSFIKRKISMLEKLMDDFVADKEQSEINDVEKCVGETVDREDFEFYMELLDDYKMEINENSRLLDQENVPSLIGIIRYACNGDVDYLFPKWLVSYAEKNDSYNKKQKENYIKMKSDFDDFIKTKNGDD